MEVLAPYKSMVSFQTKTTLCAIIHVVVSTEATTVHRFWSTGNFSFSLIKPTNDVHAVRHPWVQ